MFSSSSKAYQRIKRSCFKVLIWCTISDKWGILWKKMKVFLSTKIIGNGRLGFCSLEDFNKALLASNIGG